MKVVTQTREDETQKYSMKIASFESKIEELNSKLAKANQENDSMEAQLILYFEEMRAIKLKLAEETNKSQGNEDEIKLEA